MKITDVSKRRPADMLREFVRMPDIRSFDRVDAMTAGGIFILQTAAIFITSLLFHSFAPASLAAGIALGVLYLTRPSFWPAILLGSLVGFTLTDASVPITLICSISYTLQAAVAAYILRTSNFDARLARLRDSALLLLVLVGTAMILPTINVLIELLFSVDAMSSLSADQSSWGTLWTHAIFGMLFTAPFIIRWSVKPHQRTQADLLEIFVCVGMMMGITWLLFWQQILTVGSISLVYVLLIPLLWSSLRLGPRITVSALTISAFIAHLGITAHLGMPVMFYPTELIQQFFQVELFYIIVAGIFLIIVSIEEERKEQTRELQAHVSGLTSELRGLSDEDRLKNEFIAILGHELRNPLAPVVSILELLRLQKDMSADSLRLVGEVEHQIQTVRHLLDDLLDITRVTQKKFELRKEVSTLNTVLLRCVAGVEYFMKSYNHNLLVSLLKEDVTVYVDPTRLEQIVTNLLYNAAKYTEPGGHIELACEVREPNIVICVTDNGMGIRPESLRDIFLPFRQAHERPRAGAGLGIGLSITKQLVEMHEGTISVESEGKGKGSKFTVMLPILYAGQKPKHAAEQHAVGTKIPPRNILVVDDNESAANALKKLLEHRGHRVYVAHTGKEAISNAMLFKPEVIFLDIELPDIDGYEVVRHLRASGFHTKTIALTGFGQEEDKLKAEEAGFDHHLVKPVSLASIENLL